MHSSDKRLPHLRTSRDQDLPEQDDSIDDGNDRNLPWGWKSSKPVFAVAFELPEGTKRSFRYMHLESDMTYKPGEIVMRFAGMRCFTVTITGLRLESLFYLLQDDRMRVVRQTKSEFDNATDEPLVQSISIIEEKAELGIE